MLHVSESLQWRHGVILNTIKIGLVRVFDVKVRLAAKRVIRRACQVPVNWSDLVGDVRESLIEKVGALLHNRFEGFLGCPVAFAGILKFLFRGTELGLDGVES